MNSESKITAFHKVLKEKKLDAFLVSQPQNRHYLSGFDGTAGFLIITRNKSILATDTRYTERARHQAPDYKIVTVSGGTEHWLAELLSQLGIKKLGFESRHITFNIYQKMENTLPSVELIPLEDTVEKMRQVK